MIRRFGFLTCLHVRVLDFHLSGFRLSQTAVLMIVVFRFFVVVTTQRVVTKSITNETWLVHNRLSICKNRQNKQASKLVKKYDAKQHKQEKFTFDF